MALRSGEESPLWNAVRADNVEEVKAIIAAKVDVAKVVQPPGWTALHVAAGNGSLKVAALLLSQHADINATAADNETPLHLAAQQGETEAIRFLARNGATIGARNEDQETPLHVAVQHIGSKTVDHIVALLEARADPSETDSGGQTATAQAHTLTNRGTELEALLGESAAADRGRELDYMLHALCKKGHAEAVVKALKLSNVVLPAATAQRALIHAAMGGNVEVTQALVSAQADPCLSEVDPNTGMTCLIAAADEGKTKMVKWLLAQRADARVHSRDGATALMAATMHGTDDAVQVLLQARSDVNHSSYTGWTALMVASQAGKVSVVRQLLDSRAALNATDNDGNTARDLAATNCHPDVVKALDTRSKLDARRAKAVPKTTDALPEDERDLDSLLASLGEPTSGSSKCSKSKAKKKGSKQRGPTDEESKQALSSPKGDPPQALGRLHEDVLSSQKMEATKPLVTKTSTGKKKQKISSEIRIALQSRLEEIARQRAALDAEEAQIKEQLSESDS